MGIRKWLSRKIGSESTHLAVAEEVIKNILNDREIIRIMKERGHTWKSFEEIMLRTYEPYKITEPEFYKAFMEKWEEYKKRIYQYEFDQNREKYT